MPDRLVKQKEMAALLGCSVSYLRASDAPKRWLPSLTPGGRPMLRYDVEEVRAWTARDREDAA